MASVLVLCVMLPSAPVALIPGPTGHECVTGSALSLAATEPSCGHHVVCTLLPPPHAHAHAHTHTLAPTLPPFTHARAPTSYTTLESLNHMSYTQLHKSPPCDYDVCPLYLLPDGTVDFHQITFGQGALNVR